MSAESTSLRQRPLVPLLVGLFAVILLVLAVVTAIGERDRAGERVRTQLTVEARDQKQVLDHYFERARSLTLLLAQNSAFADFYRMGGSRLERIRSRARPVRQANRALSGLEDLFPGEIGEAGFIDDGGAENARAVAGAVTPAEDLSATKDAAPFFQPALAQVPGHVYQAPPYISPDTREWVITNATPVELPAGAGKAIVHYELTLESLRAEAAASAGGFEVTIIDARSGHAILDTGDSSPLRLPASTDLEQGHSHNGPTHLGFNVPPDFHLLQVLAETPLDSGFVHVGETDAAFSRVDSGLDNANRWMVVVHDESGALTLLDSVGAAQIGLLALGLLLLPFALIGFRSSQRSLQHAALTDPLTGLCNRRKLMVELERSLRAATPDRPVLLALYDLDGFKAYNDSFGHPAGDVLLVRMADQLRQRLGDNAEAYRIGGDEFCVLATGEDAPATVERVVAALSEHGEGFLITSSGGWVELPREAANAEDALKLADQRMYARKNAGRASAGAQSTDVLVRVLAERHPELGEHLDDTVALCERVMPFLDISDVEQATIRRAAALHDIGKIAVPDSILNKPGPLTDTEWVFIKQHTVIGERILAAAPALTRASQLVRWSHERYDGTGYPDQLEGEDIPLGSRLITVCDAFDAMTTDRPYAPAMSLDDGLAELRRCAGAQFDPIVVEACAAALGTPEAETVEPVPVPA